MNFDYRSQKEILKNFPNIELSYEKKLHKKVQTDIYLTIPKGKKYFAWFKYFNGKNICFLLEINRRLNETSPNNYSHMQFCFYVYRIIVSALKTERFMHSVDIYGYGVYSP